MPTLDEYRNQHREIEALFQELESHLAPAFVAAHAVAVQALLSRLSSKLGVHLALEDSFLYPAFFTHPDPDVGKAAHRYQDEMGGLMREFQGYYAKWHGAPALHGDPTGFIEATQSLLALVRKRIAAEDGHLYVLAERVLAHSG